MMGNIRLRLGGNARANRPGDDLLLQQVCSHVRTLWRHKANTSNPWDFRDTLIDAEQSEDTYLINDPAFGKPLAVLTRDDMNPQHIVRIIPFYCPQDLAYDWGMSNNVGAFVVNGDGSQHTAQRCAFFWRNNQAYIQFQPIPQLACQYQVRYIANTAGTVDGMALTQEPLPSEDADLVEIRAAKSLLSNTEWMASDSAEGRAYNSDKRKELLVTLRDDEALAQRQFEAAQLLTTGPRTHNRWTTAGI